MDWRHDRTVAQIVAQKSTTTTAPVKIDNNQLDEMLQKSDEAWRRRMEEQDLKWQQYNVQQQNSFQQALYDQREVFNQQMVNMQAQMNDQIANLIKLIPNLATPNPQTPITPVTPYTITTSPAISNQQTLVPPYSTMQSPMSIST